MPLTKTRVRPMTSGKSLAKMYLEGDISHLTPSELDDKLDSAFHAHMHGKITDEELDEIEAHLATDYVEATKDLVKGSIRRSVSCILQAFLSVLASKGRLREEADVGNVLDKS